MFNQITLLFIFIQFLGCQRGSNFSEVFLIDLNTEVEIDEKAIYTKIGFQNQNPIFKNVYTNDFVKYVDNRFIKLSRKSDREIDYVSDNCIVLMSKEVGGYQYEINSYNGCKSLFTSSQKISYNISRSSEAFIYQIQYLPGLYRLVSCTDTVLKVNSDQVYNPIVRNGILFYSKYPGSNSLANIYCTKIGILSQERQVVEGVYDESVEVSDDGNLIIAQTQTLEGQSYILYYLSTGKLTKFPDISDKYLPLRITNEEVLFYNPIGLDIITKVIGK